MNSSPILHTIAKVRKNAWYIWKGNPSVLDEREAFAGPFAKRYEALTAAHQMVELPRE